MSDFSQTKKYGTAIYPVHAADTSGLVKRCEPILTPDKLRSRYLKGIPMTFPNGDVITDDDLKDKIMLAINEAELMLNMTINRESFQEKHPFDYSLYQDFLHVRAEHGPVASIEHMQITSADGQNIFEVPPQWIETAQFAKRQINVIPLIAGYGFNSVQGSVVNGGLGFFGLSPGMIGFIPSYWEIKYTAGMSFKEGQVPVPVNELIGVLAAIDVLSLIAPTNVFNSQSISQDGLSQSSSSPGNRIYELRLSELENKKEAIIKKLKGIFSGKFFVGNF